MAEDLHIRGKLLIPDREFHYRFTRSSGPGGQNVNKVATRVDLCWHPSSSEALDDKERVLLLQKLSTRLDSEGWLCLKGQEYRTREANRAAVRERMAEILREALHEDAPRKASRPTRASRRRRKESKQRRGETKKLRRKPGQGD